MCFVLMGHRDGVLEYENNAHETPLKAAVRSGNSVIVNRLLTFNGSRPGFNVNNGGSDGTTPLMLAVSN